MIDERPDANRVSLKFATPHEEWDWRIARSLFLTRQFDNAEVVRPESGLQSKKRIQRLAGQGAGNNWAGIANTVGFIDPLHSTGIAHTLFSVSRLADILLSDCKLAARTKRLQEYSDMLYFAAATSMEQMPADRIGDVSFLRANDVTFREMLREARQRLGDARRTIVEDRASCEANFKAWLTSAVVPWNQVGLFDDLCNNLYSRTAAPADAW